MVQKISYEITLHVIGQDLVTLLIDSLEITADGEDFVVKGVRITSTAEAPQEDREKSWLKLFSFGRRSDEIRYKIIHEPFFRRYTPEDIKRLDKIAKSRRIDRAEMQDVLTLAEALRTLGRAVDSGGGQLVRLVKNGDKFALEHKDANGLTHKDEHTTLSLHRSRQTGMDLQQTKEKDPWLGVDN